MGNKTGNVVQLHEHAAFTRRFSPANTARLLHECKDRVITGGTEMVARALDNADDALFALADKAETNAQQAHFFEAMREIRLKRQDIEKSFKEDFTVATNALIADPSTTSTLGISRAITDTGTSLVENDNLEETLAISTLIDKLNALCQDELNALSQRIEDLINQEIADIPSIPMGPESLCMAFKSACQNIESGVDIKIIIFKLFDRYVSESIETLYHEINVYLADKGVLPNMVMQSKGKNHSHTSSDASQELANENTLKPDFPASSAQKLNHDAPQSGPTIDHTPSVTEEDNFLQALTQAQRGRWDALNDMGVTFDAATLSSGKTNVIRLIKDHVTNDGITDDDRKVIEAVTLLFDYIIDNPEISDRAKDIIGHLQIPTLKAAILDQSFFSKRQHPVRLLLDTLTNAALGQNKGLATGSTLHQEIADSIHKIQADFTTDITVFETALSKLRTCLDQHQRRLEKNIEEAKKVIRGRERLKIAETTTKVEIESRLDGKPCPEFIKTFALAKWKNLLLVAYLKQGQESDAWKKRLELLDLLIWSTLPKATNKDREKLASILPTLVSSLKTGMKMLSMEEDEQAKFLKELAACHAKATNAETLLSKPAGLTVSFLPIEGSEVTIPLGTASKRTLSPAESGAIQVEQVTSLGSTTISQTLPQGDSGERLLIDINPFGTISNTPKKSSTDEFTNMVRDLAPGAWIEFRNKDGTKCVERLSWVSEVLSSYLFTDNNGLKSRELSAKDLENALRSGQAEVADDLNTSAGRSFNDVLDDLQKKIVG